MKSTANVRKSALAGRWLGGIIPCLNDPVEIADPVGRLTRQGIAQVQDAYEVYLNSDSHN